jgi:hypothetical protein
MIGRSSCHCERSEAIFAQKQGLLRRLWLLAMTCSSGFVQWFCLAVLRLIGQRGAFVQPIDFFPSNTDHARVADMDPARRRVTYEGLLQVADLLIAQIVDGELLTSSWPASPGWLD